MVTIFDADSKQPIWRGFAEDAISDKPGRIEKVHDAAVARMFEAAQSADSAPTDFASAAHGVSGPKIIFSTVPAVLVMVEGEPILRDVTGTTLKRVVNTKALILRDEADAVLHQDARRLDAGVRARQLMGSVRRATAKRRHRIQAGSCRRERESSRRVSDAGTWRETKAQRRRTA